MWPNPQFPAGLVTFTEEILNGKLHFFAVAASGTNPRTAVKKFYIKMLNFSFHISRGQIFNQKPLFLKNRYCVNQKKTLFCYKVCLGKIFC